MFLEITMKVKGTFQDLAVFGVGTLKTLDRTNLVKFDLMPEFFYTLGKSGFEFEIEIQNQSESIYIRELRSQNSEKERRGNNNTELGPDATHSTRGPRRGHFCCREQILGEGKGS